MASKHRIPWPGTALASLAFLILRAAGCAPWPSLGVALLWAGSLWYEWWRSRPDGRFAFPPERPDLDGLARDAMNRVIEPVSQPLILTDSKCIVAANAAARAMFGAHIIDQDTRMALRHPDAVKLLEQPRGGSVTIRGLTDAGSQWHLIRRRIDEHQGHARPELWLIELIDRTAEADVGRAHTDFVANASHELRTPLASVIGYVETLVDDPAGIDRETMQRFLSIVLREAQRMHALVTDLMSLSHLEAEKHDVPTESLDMGQLAARVVSEFTCTAALASDSGQGRLTLSRADAAFLVAGDAKQLEQLLRNLIDNAFKYGASTQPVHVELRRIGRGARRLVQLSVTDHGAGIAPEHVPHLTRRFYRTDPGRSRAAGGTGLGLAIVKHIVERHRGRLDIASELGKGTVVTVQLPVANAP